MQHVVDVERDGHILAIGHVHNHLGGGAGGLHGLVALLHKLREAGPAAGRDFAFGPQHAVAGFVAHLHPIGHDVVGLEGIKHVRGVVVHGLFQLSYGVGLPGSGLGLLACWGRRSRRCSGNQSSQNGVVHLRALSDVVEHRLAAARGPDGAGHAVGKGRHGALGLVAVRLVAHLEGEDARVLPNQLLGVGVAVVEELREVALLRRHRARVGAGLALAVNARKARAGVLFRVAVFQ